MNLTANYKIAKKITNWLKDYSERAGLHTYVVGVSGGIDSALTSTLCAETGHKTIVVSMPLHQNPEQLKLAHEHIDWLTSKYKNVFSQEKDLTSVFETFKALLNEGERRELALANSRSRLRMLTLYQVAQSNDGLVVGTGNKVEDFGVGFFTKYGDGAVDISPIADLMKSEVRALACGLEISENIINAPPTDGLWGDNRTDEEQLGASYSELEWAMSYDGKEELTSEKKKVLELYYNLHAKNKHKMVPIPVCQIGE
jgi:NAD+ synthase